MRKLSYFVIVLMMPCIALAQSEETISSNTIIEELAGHSPTRGIRVQEQRELAGRSIDLSIEFEFDSSRLTPQASKQLAQLIAALGDPKLSDYRFSIVGHTDEKGESSYNKALSLARAGSVEAYLRDEGISGDRLDVIGKGESELLHPDEPEDAANRRVQIINLGKK